MSRAMRLETRWLHQDHAKAVRELREHGRACIACQRRVLYPDGAPCETGRALRARETGLQRRVREADEADAAPVPGQAALFGEVAAPR